MEHFLSTWEPFELVSVLRYVPIYVVWLLLIFSIFKCVVISTERCRFDIQFCVMNSGTNSHHIDCAVHGSVAECCSTQKKKLQIALALVILRDKPFGQEARNFVTDLQSYCQNKVAFVSVFDIHFDP